MKGLWLGIDTSNYTTSIALADEKGKIVFEKSILLTVKDGERGLRQSEALYQHINNLPLLFESIPRTEHLKSDLRAICYSDRPRPLEASYMPVFKAGISYARSLGSLMDVETMAVSHQENHIRSAIYGSGLEPHALKTPFLATHFSGGTSEILLVNQKEKGYLCKIVGTTLDLNAGQLVDRIGVHLGYGFPAGKALEQLAQKATTKDCIIPSSVEKMDFHFSGQENKAKALLSAGIPPQEVAYGVHKSIAKTLSKALYHGTTRYKTQDVLFSGGVMSNQLIRKMVEKALIPKGIRLHFTEPRYAADNAAGCALLGKEYRT